MSATATQRFDWKVGQYGTIERDYPEQTWREWRETYAHSLLYDGPGPLSGLTVAKAELLRDTFYGFPVRVKTHSDMRERRRNGCTFGILTDIHLPGGWHIGGPAAIGDVVVKTCYPDEKMFVEEAVGGGSSRVMGPGALVEFDVVAPERWIECWNCGRFRPRHRLRHEWRWTEEWTEQDFECMETFEWVCRGTTEEGYCR